MRQDALWVKRRQIDAVGLPIDDQLRHGEAAGWGIQNAPAAMAGGDIGTGDIGYLAQERQAILCHRAIARLYALWG